MRAPHAGSTARRVAVLSQLRNALRHFCVTLRHASLLFASPRLRQRTTMRASLAWIKAQAGCDVGHPTLARLKLVRPPSTDAALACRRGLKACSLRPIAGALRPEPGGRLSWSRLQHTPSPRSPGLPHGAFTPERPSPHFRAFSRERVDTPRRAWYVARLRRERLRERRRSCWARSSVGRAADS